MDRPAHLLGEDDPVHPAGGGDPLLLPAIPFGSSDVALRAGRVVTPSLATGVVTASDATGRIRWRTRVAPATHHATVLTGG